MKKRKLIIIPLILSLVIFLAMIVLLISTYSIDKLKENDITECMATLTDAEIIGSEDNMYLTIHTEEYGDKLFVSSGIIKKIDLNDISNLEKGQRISFGVESSMLEELTETGYAAVVCLKTEDKEIFSLSNYNENMHNSMISARATAMVVALIFLLLSVHCILLLKGINIFKRFKK